jgi:hypothetical protein
MGYKEMYLKLFNGVTDAIGNLQALQQETEEMYISAPEPDVRLLNPEGEDEKQ